MHTRECVHIDPAIRHTQTPTHRTQTSHEVFVETKLLKILRILLYDSVPIADVNGFGCREALI